jgi:hypothetical protein
MARLALLFVCAAAAAGAPTLETDEEAPARDYRATGFRLAEHALHAADGARDAGAAKAHAHHSWWWNRESLP